MRELSLNILDITENSLKAQATVIKIGILAQDNLLTITIEDNGCGMSEEFLAKVIDPYTTTRTTRKVGLGIPFIKMQAEMCGGTFHIQSQLGVGTTVTVTFQIDHIDRPPLGNVGETIMTLLPDLGQTQLVFVYKAKGNEFELDTKEIIEQLDGIPLDTPEVLIYIKETINENITIINGGTLL